MEEKTLIVALKSFFGWPPAGSKFSSDLKGFSQEVKELTQQDRNELAAMFLEQGIKVIPPPGKTEV